MNRIEIVGLFSAIKKLCKLKAYDEVEQLVDEVLIESREKSSELADKNKKETDEKLGT